MEFPYQSKTKPSVREAVTTVDDCLREAENLMTHLRQLARQKHPLDVRKGTSLKRGNQAARTASPILKAGGKTYFFDIKQDKENRPYLVITESRFQQERGQRERTRITVFSEHARDFLQALHTIIEQL